MMNLILIPSFDSYKVVTLIMLGCGSFILPMHIQGRWLQGISCHLMAINAWIKGCIVLLGSTIVPVTHLFSGKILVEIVSLGLGLGVGYLLTFIIIKINRAAARNSNKRFTKNIFQSRSSIVHTQRNLFSMEKNNRKKRIGINQSTNHLVHYSSHYDYGLLSILLVAMFEEIIFRGYFTYFALQVDGVVMVLLLLMFNVVFGISHLSLGWIQCVEKTILGMILTGLTVGMGSLTVAVMGHGILNYFAWKLHRASSVSRKRR